MSKITTLKLKYDKRILYFPFHREITFLKRIESYKWKVFDRVFENSDAPVTIGRAGCPKGQECNVT